MRIRSIKPEFFDSPSTADSSPWARLLYIAMWCMADDWGVGSANLKEMSANAFPNDDEWTSKELPSLCKEVADNYGVMFYTHRGRPYFQIPTWDDHQVTQRRAKRRFPAHDDPESTPDQAIHGLPSLGKEVPSRNKENSSTEQGNRGTGEQGTGEVTTLFNAADAPIERDHTTTEPTTDYPADFEDFWNTYPRRQKKRDALKAFTNAKKRATLPAIIAGAEQLRDDPNRIDQYTPLAASWLNANGWEDEPLPPRHNNHQPSRAQQRWNNNAAVVARFQEREQARGEIAQ
ncbi:hypothetical protein M3B11_02780 [Brevibacterium sp. p3-SID960]|uniref:hypothetical protein n=1 Tax=Brevibacterium sp. p3-SID960 TaxID=2916063 RepID=UPI0021A7D689|nr:hypothetical protein [Brevibacterium sp. p3-SID960]MCT1689893.1 hypothetical protein [Brevibacterium sp. p3-SID960]